MSTRILILIELAGPVPDGTVIPAAWFDTLLVWEQPLEEAEYQAVLILSAPRRKDTAIFFQAARRQRRIRREFLAERARLEQALLRRGER